MGDEISTFVPAVASTNALEQLGTLAAMQQSSSAETFAGLLWFVAWVLTGIRELQGLYGLGLAIAALILSAILRR